MCEKTQKRHTREARGSFFVNICTTSGWTKIKVTKVSESQTLIRAPGSCRGEKKPNWEADFRDFVPVAALATPTGCSGYTVAFCVYPSQLAEKMTVVSEEILKTKIQRQKAQFCSIRDGKILPFGGVKQ